MRRAWVILVTLGVLGLTVSVALGACNKALDNNRREALAQLRIFQVHDLSAKRSLSEKDADVLMREIASDHNESDFRPDRSCLNDAQMYYRLANVLAGLNSFALYRMRAQALPVGLLEPFIGHAELTLALFKQILQADVNVYHASHIPVPSETQALAARYLTSAQPKS